jgi:hypothetical protein
VENVHGYIDDQANYPYATVPVRCLYGTFHYCYLGNISLRSGVGTTGYPYVDDAFYPIVEILGGQYNTLDLPADQVASMVYLGTSQTIWPLTFVQGPVPRIENVTNTVYEWEQAGCLLSNYGQGAEATITLQPAAAGMHLRFTIATPGLAYHIKPDAGNKLYLDGTALDDGDKASNAVPVVGDSLRLEAFVSGASGSTYTYDWIARSEGGTWSDGGA